MVDDGDKKYMEKVNDLLNYYTDDIKEEDIEKEIDYIIKHDISDVSSDESSSSEEDSNSSDEEYEKWKKKRKHKKKKKKGKKKKKKKKKKEEEEEEDEDEEDDEEEERKKKQKKKKKENLEDKNQVIDINKIISKNDDEIKNIDKLNINKDINQKPISQSVIPGINENMFLNINEHNKQNDDILDYYKKKNNQIEEEKPNRIIPQNIYEKIDKKDLRTVIVCLQKCNEKYEEALKLIENSLYIQALNILVESRNSYLKLKNAIQKRPEAYPKEFQQIMTIKIAEKVSKINSSISKVSPLASNQKALLYNQTNNNKINNQKINNINKDNLPNVNNKINQNINNKKEKSIHDKEEEEMDIKISSEIMSSSPGVKFSDIIGMEDLKQMVNEIIIIPTIRPDLFKGVLKPQRGILLFGPPGTGKTMIAKAIASECSSTFFNISASSLTSKWVGESEKTVRSLFKLAYQKAPSIIFIDEIDSILSKRSENDNDAAKRLKTEFLIQFDGLGSNSDAKLLVIAATNRPMDLDDALLRRLPKRVYCHPLDENGRFEFIKKLINLVDNNLTDDEIKIIAKETNGYSNGDLHELCRECAYEPVRELTGEEILKIQKFRNVTFQDMKKALLKIRGTLSPKVIKEMENWNNQFGGI